MWCVACKKKFNKLTDQEKVKITSELYPHIAFVNSDKFLCGVKIKKDSNIEDII